MNNGKVVAEFEREFSAFVGAEYAVAMNSGTATLHVALAALDEHGDKHDALALDRVVAVPPLTMAATTLAVLHAGMRPRFVDVDPDTWLMKLGDVRADEVAMPVSLYGLHTPIRPAMMVDDAAQTLRRHSGCPFTSYSLQASKILATGEGGVLVTNDEELADIARSVSSLGYDLSGSSVIDPETLKSPTHIRHVRVGWNYRMADAVARQALVALEWADITKRCRTASAHWYNNATAGMKWLRQQHVPAGWTHDYWTYAVALESPELVRPFQDAVVSQGGERPYAAWRLTYHEPALEYLGHVWKSEGECPVAEDLQPRLVQLQTNYRSHDAMARNGDAVARACRDIQGTR